GMPASHVVWDGEPLPFAATAGLPGRLHLAIVARRHLGVDEEKREYPTPDTTKITLRGQRAITVSGRAENFGSEEGFDLLESIRVGLGADDSREAFRATGVAFTSATNVRPLPARSDNREISAAQMDVFFNQGVEKVK